MGLLFGPDLYLLLKYSNFSYFLIGGVLEPGVLSGLGKRRKLL